MSGGGSGRPISGRMNTDAQKARRRSSGVPLWTETFITEKEEELAACEVRLTEARQRREQLEDTEAQLSQRIQEAQRVVTKCQVSLVVGVLKKLLAYFGICLFWQNEIERLREEAEVLGQEAEQAEVRAAQTGPSAEERDRMEGSVANLERLHVSKAEKAEELRRRVDEVKAALVDAGSARLAAVRSRVGLVESKIKEVR